MTDTEPQDSNNRKVKSNESTPMPNVHVEPGRLRITRNSQNEGVLPPQSVPVRGRLCQFVEGWKAYKERSLHVKYRSQGVQTSVYESTPSTQGSLGNKISKGPTDTSGYSRVLFEHIPGT